MSGNIGEWIGFSAPGEGRGWMNCQFCKIADSNHGDKTGTQPAFLKSLFWLTSSGWKGRIRAFTHLSTCTRIEREAWRGDVSLEDWECDSRSFNSKRPKMESERKVNGNQVLHSSIAYMKVY